MMRIIHPIFGTSISSKGDDPQQTIVVIFHATLQVPYTFTKKKKKKKLTLFCKPKQKSQFTGSVILNGKQII